MKPREAPIVIDDDSEDESGDVLLNEQRSSKRARTFKVDDEDDSIVEITRERQAGQAAQPGPEGLSSSQQQIQAKEKDQQQQLAAIALGIGGLSGLDRAALERERRERQRQRRRAAGLASESEDEQDNDPGAAGKARPTQVSSARPSASSSSTRPGPGFSFASSSSSATTSRVAATSGIGSSSPPALRRILSGDPFWDGAVKRSYNRYTSDGVPFSDFLLPTTRSNAAGLQAAIVASFDWDFAWLGSMLPTERDALPGKQGPQITFVMKERPGLPAGVHQMEKPGWVTLAVKNRGNDYSSMHIKMLLLVYQDRLRLVISTGNLNRIDWESLENAAWVQDFPLLPPGAAASLSAQGTDVKDQLVRVLRGMDVPAAHPVSRALQRYNFDKGPTLVASIPRRTAYQGRNEISLVGLGRLADQARKLLGDRAQVEVEAQGSSMGSYSQRWLQQFHLVATGSSSGSSAELKLDVLPPSGKAATKAYLDLVGKPTQASKMDRAAVLKRHDDTGKDDEAAWPPIKVLFPSRDFVVHQSVGGAAGGGCHFGKPEAFTKWKHLCYHARAERHEGVLMHQKGVLVVKKGREVEQTAGSSSSHSKDEEETIGYVVMTSANFGQNAWGNLSRPSAQAGIQLSVNNWELGVILPLKRRDLRAEAKLTTNARSAICWKRPARQYGEGDVPWSPTVQ
ncbi:phospholipase D/nuclease [Jaminaea rosea]|uniref:Phospholipase D/nuclease n=1 Tax=Jaminaea rosea TaxID=1569628 RepID=A0A316UV77_9BASI|nr:phospholipase D/nuclease [Jaminaea rosea]PWN27015.1 phospholipase D/nuclease [Jaminaea rosea]